MTERPRFPGTDHGPFGSPVQPPKRIGKDSSTLLGSLGRRGEDPLWGLSGTTVRHIPDSVPVIYSEGMERRPTPKDDATEGFGVVVRDQDAVRREYLQDLTNLHLLVRWDEFGFDQTLRGLINAWDGTAEAKQVLVFGQKYHELGSVSGAIQALGETGVNSMSMPIHNRGNTFEGEVFGLIGRRKVAPTRSGFDVVVATDDGFTLATMVLQPDWNPLFYTRRGFKKSGHSAGRTIEDVVIPACRK